MFYENKIIVFLIRALRPEVQAKLTKEKSWKPTKGWYITTLYIKEKKALVTFM